MAGVNEIGTQQAIQELQGRGFKVIESKLGRKKRLYATNTETNRTVKLRVKTRTRGNWHSRESEGEKVDNIPPPEREDTFWVLVEVSDNKALSKYWIVPGTWMRNHIYE